MSAVHPCPSWTRALSPLFLLPLVLLAGVRVATADCVDYSTYLHSLGGLKTASILRSIEVSGSLAYVAADSSGLMIMDISNPAAVTLVGSVETRGPARDVKLAGNLAYVAATDSGLVVVDITNPANPVVIGWTDTPGLSRGVALEGNYAYVADRDAGGLQVVDISDPAHPAVIGALDTPGEAYDVTVLNHRAYVADGLSGVQIIDVSTPTAPVLLGTASIPAAAWDVFVADSLAYVADFSSGLQIVNVSNPAAPEVIGGFVYPAYYAYRVVVRDNLAFLARDLTGLQIVDVSNPAAPRGLGNVGTFMDALGVDVDGNRAYVVGFPITSGRPSGLEVFDITNPASPLVTSWQSPSYFSFRRVTVASNLAYELGDSYPNSVLQIVDISNSEAPALVSTIPLDSPHAVAVSGTLALIGPQSFGSFQVYDMSNPASPLARGTIGNLHAWDIEIVGTYAYVADPTDTTGFKVVDISNPDAPSMVGKTTGSPVALAVQGNRAYTADYDAGFEVYDITQPTAPVLLGSLHLDERPNDVSISGNYAYVADFWHGLLIIDVSDPTSPTMVATLETPGPAGTVEVADHIAYVAEWSGGLQVIDVLDPLHPAPLGSRMGYAVESLDLSGDHVYLARFGGLDIVPRQCALLVPVAVSRFQAIPEPGAIELRWTADADLAGFHVHRSVAGAPFERINGSLLTASGSYVFRDEHVEPGQYYAYRLEAVDRRGESTFFGPYIVSSSTGLVHYRLGMSRPNPFRASNISTRIDFDIAHPARTMLRILDVTGAQVRVLLDAPLPAGSHFAMWDGKDERGRRAAAGTYFYQLVSGSFSKTERLVVTP